MEKDQTSPAFWARVALAKRSKAIKYKSSWRLKKRQDEAYLLRDREIRAAAMCRFRAKKRAAA